jgi:selenide,water dikinase
LRPLGNIFKAQDYPDLIVGINPPDDAAVWRIDDSRSIVVTTDFFTPVVDEPYDYGAIAAANSLSDIYAMGAIPFLALNIAAFPPQLPAEFLSEIIRGAAEKAKEAGVVIAGGHTIQDKEPKFGLVVIGMLETKNLLTKSAVQPDDLLILTKPLGIGVTTTANKAEKAKIEDIQEAKLWMHTLNKLPSQLAVQLELKAATDITGFSLLGHAYEMASTSKVELVFTAKKIPFLRGARQYGEKWFFAGGAADNQLFYKKFVNFSQDIDEVTEMLLFDPQTSGGLLIACPPSKIHEFESSAHQLNIPYWIIGQAFPGQGLRII